MSNLRMRVGRLETNAGYKDLDHKASLMSVKGNPTEEELERLVHLHRQENGLTEEDMVVVLMGYYPE